jgi:eukaryotic-like serine/threonine-protein kinase
LALAPGTRLGVCDITAQIGAGGMGEVYQATDTNLKRQVAIKVLPTAVAGDTDRLARFQREAEVLAALNHPNIAAIYGLEKTPDCTALVMELVEGEDLSQRISRGAIPIDEALPIAKQIAEALEAAHEHGIIHRDLKPANIKVRLDGTVKVLDFGLAKAMEPAAGSSPSISMSPTLTSPAMTRAGMILGTAAYMSPEQAKGRVADKRSDVWSFGCVLYEMLTGRRAFDPSARSGSDGGIAETLAFVMMKDPDWSAFPAAVPAYVLTIVKRCLEKDRNARIPGISVVRFMLADGPAPAIGDSTIVAAHVRPAAWWRALPWAISGVLAVGGLIPATLYFRRAAPERSLTRLELTTPPASDAVSMALSPDGRQIAFVAAGEGGPKLWVRRFDQGAATALPSTDGATYPFWAPNGRAIGFFADGKVKRIDLSGGAPQTLADASAGRGGAWSADGVILFSPTANSGLVRIPDTGGVPVPVTQPKTGENSHRWPQFLPDGYHFLFRMAVGRPETRGTYVGSLEGGSPTRVLKDETAAVFAPPDLLLVVRQGELMALRFDPTRAAVTGQPVPVAQNVGAATTIERGAFTVSATGVLAHRPGDSQRRQLAWVDRAGHPVGTVGGPDDGSPSNPTLAPDGQRVAVSRDIQGNGNVWLLDARGVPSRFTFDSGLDTTPVWSPDGRRLAFRSNRNGVFDLFEKAASGAADEQRLLVTSENKAPQSWSPDGRTLLYTTVNQKTGVDLWALPLDGDKKPFPVLQSAFDEMDAEFSPDGHWIAYESNQSGQAEIFVRAFPESRGQWQVSTAGGTQPRWRTDGKELFYMSRDGHLTATPIATAADGQAITPGSPVALFALRLASGSNVTIGSYGGRPQYAVARDGRFLVDVAVDAEATPPISVVLNWDAPFKK